MRSLSVHLTDLCNSRCSFCVVGSPLYAKDSIDINDVNEFLVQNANSGFTDVNLHGGEATIHPKFFDILKLIRQLGYPEIHLQTNGIRLADEQYARAVIDYGVTLFIVSLHGDDEDTHDSQTGTVGGFKKTISGIRNAKEFGSQVRTNTVITRKNVKRLSSITSLACELGVDHINFSNVHPVGSALFSFDRVVPDFSSVREYLYPAIDLALGGCRTVTLEGFPYCTVPEYVSLNLNEHPREIKMLMRGMTIDNYDSFMNATCRALAPPCERCTVVGRCGGIYPEYLERAGWGDFHAI